MYAEQDILTGIDLMRHKIEHLETKVEEIHTILERVLLIVLPVVFTTPDGSKRPFRPNRPVSLQTLATMARVEELSQVRRHLSAEERTEVFLQNVEQARAEAIRKGIAIDDEREAAIGD
ncbi:MAG: hypothetical protein H8D78_11910 [Chloroflexi bacterium]|nr:hypothetical protein [Chloroflexota bacterium]